MGYAADNDDAEQVAQGEDGGEHEFDEFVRESVGREYWELSCRERVNVKWQWGQECKRRKAHNAALTGANRNGEASG